MRFTASIDAYISDMQAQGRINSPSTERAYRATLVIHADEVGNRDPRATNRRDVKRTLDHWQHPTTRSKNLAVIRSFYDWCMEEGLRKDNPARQVRRPRRRPAAVYRLTVDETRRMLAAARGSRERRVIYLGLCAGLRNQELRGLQGRHFRRPGWVWVSADIAKGQRERWVPVLVELEPVWDEIAAGCADDDFVIPSQRFSDPGVNRRKADRSKFPASGQTVWRLVRDVGKRAEIPADVYPHMMRHAFADHIARGAGIRAAQSALGHAGIATTETYLGKPTLDELAAAFRGLRIEPAFSPVVVTPVGALEPPIGFEPMERSIRSAERILQRLFASEALRAAARGMG